MGKSEEAYYIKRKHLHNVAYALMPYQFLHPSVYLSHDILA